MTTSPAYDDSCDDLRWVVRLWVVVLVFVAATLWRSQAIGVPLRDPGGEFLRGRMLLSAGILVGLVLLDAARRTKRHERRLRPVLRTLRSRWPARRLALAVTGLVAYHVVYFSYHNLKSWNAFRGVDDALLASADRVIFFGHDPAALLHSLLGTDTAAYVLLVVYESFPTLVSVAFVAAVALCDRMRQGYVMIASMIWAWILGTASYYVFPSLGPFHQDPGDFADLPRTLVTRTQAEYMSQRGHLLTDPGAHDAFAQIGAFASLHIAMSAVILLMMRYYGFRTATRIMTAYVAVTIVATVYLGWHFFVDDVAGVLIAAAAVALGAWTIYPPSWPRRRRSSDPTTTPLRVGQ